MNGLLCFRIKVHSPYIINPVPNFCNNHLQKWPELDRMPRDLLVVMPLVPDGPVPCQSNPRHPHLAQCGTISTLIIQETTMQVPCLIINLVLTEAHTSFATCA